MSELTSVEFLKFFVPVMVAVIAWMLNEHSKRKWEKWQMKREASLKALNIANAILSNYEFGKIKKNDITPQYASIEDVRACFNELACTCDGPEVIDGLKRIMFETVSPDAIVDLRAAVRKELGFRGKVVDNDRAVAFIAKINCNRDR